MVRQLRAGHHWQAHLSHVKIAQILAQLRNVVILHFIFEKEYAPDV